MKLTWTLSACICALLVTGCGGEAGDAPAGNSETIGVPGTGEKIPRNGIESFSFTQQGAQMHATYDVPSMELRTAGCGGGKPFQFQFDTMGKPDDPAIFLLKFTGDNSPAPGETGEFPLSELVWLNGRDFEQTYPDRFFNGSGTLTISEHTGGGISGRMVATVAGEVSNSRTGETADIRAEFDVHRGCTVEGPRY